ncbi:MAG: DUF4956 domain-containing protein, partial [Chitinophagales bacterium]
MSKKFIYRKSPGILITFLLLFLTCITAQAQSPVEKRIEETKTTIITTDSTGKSDTITTIKSTSKDIPPKEEKGKLVNDNTESKPAPLLDIDWYDRNLLDLIVRSLFNFFMVYLLIKFIYRSDKKNKNYAFSYYLFSMVIFFLCSLLQNVKLEIGFAFGLFAIFSILRYRTISIPMKEMTYLFLTIAIAVINAMTSKQISFAELIYTNLSLLAASYFLERLWYKEGLSEQLVEYEKIENIKPEKRDIMLQDLKDRTGLDIRNFEIISTDFLR